MSGLGSGKLEHIGRQWICPCGSRNLLGGKHHSVSVDIHLPAKDATAGSRGGCQTFTGPAMGKQFNGISGTRCARGNLGSVQRHRLAKPIADGTIRVGQHGHFRPDISSPLKYMNDRCAPDCHHVAADRHRPAEPLRPNSVWRCQLRGLRPLTICSSEHVRCRGVFLKLKRRFLACGGHGYPAAGTNHDCVIVHRHRLAEPAFEKPKS